MISVIVRDLDPHPPTLEFIPDEVDEIIVSNWKAPDFDEGSQASQMVESMAVARNDGALQATGDKLVFLDGDVKFTEEFFWKTVELCEKGTVVGIENPWQGHLQGAYIVITRKDFYHAGGVDPHFFYNEDRAFGYKLKAMGYRLTTFPMSNIENLDPSPTRYCLNFPLYLRMQLTLLLKYPRQHWWRLPRSLFDFFYHLFEHFKSRGGQ